MDKIAVTGKGGVGKTTISAALSVIFAREKKVIAIDADPDSNLAATIGFPSPEKIIPISQMKDIIDDRTGAKNGFFKMNPKVDDIPEKYCPEYKNIRLINMGALKKGGSGCFCPENAFLKALISYLVLNRDEVLIIDMPAGIENLSRGTASAVDAVLIIVEPDIKSLETAERIKKLCNDLKIKNIFMIGNKVLDKSDENFIKENAGSIDILGFIKHDKNLRDSRGKLSENLSMMAEIEKIKSGLEDRNGRKE